VNCRIPFVNWATWFVNCGMPFVNWSPFHLGFVLGSRAGEVHHEEPHRGEVLKWKKQNLSVAIMLRTSLFPYNRARLRNTTPSPVPVFESLALSFRQALVSEAFVLPSYAQVMAEHAI
jgi:hypothetical protein